MDFFAVRLRIWSMSSRLRFRCFLLASIALLTLAGCGGSKSRSARFDGQGVAFVYPGGWSVTGFSRTVSPARLVVASYRVTRSEVEGDCGGMRALAALPRDGAAVLLIDYGPGPANSQFRPRPSRFRLGQFKQASYECFGDSYMLRFHAAGHELQTHLVFGRQAVATQRSQALGVLDTLRSK
jgi:hypothetical protein